MRRNQAASLFQHGAIRTTEAKAKELRRFVEKIITTAKQGTLHARRRVIAELGRNRRVFDENQEPTDQTVLQKLFDEIAPRYADRPGGYTRIIRLAERRIGDAGRQVLLQLVEETPSGASGEAQGASRRRRRAAKRHEAAAETPAPEAPAEAETPVEADSPAQEQPPAEAEDQAATEGANEPEGQEKADKD